MQHSRRPSRAAAQAASQIPASAHRHLVALALAALVAAAFGLAVSASAVALRDRSALLDACTAVSTAAQRDAAQSWARAYLVTGCGDAAAAALVALAGCTLWFGGGERPWSRVFLRLSAGGAVGFAALSAGAASAVPYGPLQLALPVAAADGGRCWEATDGGTALSSLTYAAAALAAAFGAAAALLRAEGRALPRL
jgi:hypothetical protein